MKIEITQELLERYHQGQCTTDEQIAIKQWLQNIAESDFTISPPIDIQGIEDKTWAELSSRIFPESEPRKINWNRLTGIAASVILVVSFAFYIYHSSGSHREKDSNLMSYHEVKVPRGKKATCTLPDGTIIQLNSDSKLRYPEKFTDTSRVVEFEGEAFFTVAKDKKRPFSINSKQVVVRVLGTHFNLRAYPEENKTDVVVEEGRVMFSPKAKKASFILIANQQGVYDVDQSLKKQTVYAAAYYSWRTNQLQFKDQKLSDIASTLERWYNVKVLINNRLLRNERYTGRFNNPDIKSVLNSLEFAVGLHYQITGNIVTIY
jgi:transmembrane sensor